MVPQVFMRTTCACPDCVDCCKRQPGPLAPGDVVRLMNELGPRQFELKFVASPGALVSRGVEPFRVGTIVPRSDAQGRCVFLDENERCKIHASAPFGCAYFDVHMPVEVAGPRAAWYLVQIMESPEYGAIRSLLPKAVSWKPTPFKV